jgi:hypothetical protein
MTAKTTPTEQLTKQDTPKSAQSVAKICKRLANDGSHCISSILSTEEKEKYGEAAKVAIMDRKDRSGTSMLTTRGLYGVLNSEKKTHRLIDSTNISENILPDIGSSETIIAPSETRFHAKWFNVHQKKAKARDAGANTFGGFGTLEVSSIDAMPIPVMNAKRLPKEFLAQYGVRLVALTSFESIDFGSADEVMSFHYEFHPEYIDRYVMQDGGGFYLETHPFPHIAIPLNKNCSGSYTVARKVSEDEYAIVSFKIPFGYALIVDPMVMHDDATLKGHHVIALTNDDEKNVDTVLMRTKGGNKQQISLRSTRPETVSGEGVFRASQFRSALFAENTMAVKTNLERLINTADKREPKQRNSLINYLKTVPLDVIGNLSHELQHNYYTTISPS